MAFYYTPRFEVGFTDEDFLFTYFFLAQLWFTSILFAIVHDNEKKSFLLI